MRRCLMQMNGGCGASSTPRNCVAAARRSRAGRWWSAALILLWCDAGIGSAQSVAPANVPPPRSVVDTVSFDTREGTRLAFDVSPDGSYLLFDLLGQLWRVPSTGGPATAVTDAVRDVAEDLDPAISPDGQRIVFQSDRPGGRALWLMPASGGAARKLTTRLLPYFAYAQAAWAPDGRRVAYAIGDTLAILDVDDGRETVVRIDSVPPPTARAPWIPANGSPAWSPDGSSLAFVNAADGRIWEVPALGGRARPLTSVRALAPAWSRDGSRLAYFARDSADRMQLWVRPRDGTPTRLTAHEDVVIVRARWAPDGSSVYYAADGGLWRVALDGSAPVAVPFTARVTIPRRRSAIADVRFSTPGSTRTAVGFTAIALSPDARRIAMIALDTVWVFSPGGRARAVAAAPWAGDGDLAWSPDGAQIAWTRNDGPGLPTTLVAAEVATGRVRVVARGPFLAVPRWSPDGKWIAVLGGGRLRLLDAHADTTLALAAARDLGSVRIAWGSISWTPQSDALLASHMNLDLGEESGEWIPLSGERRVIPQFPRAPAHMQLFADGRAVYVQGNQLWRVGFDPAGGGISGAPALLSTDPALEARYARDGSVLYLSTNGLRLRRPDGTIRDVPWPLRYRVPPAPAPLLIRGARVIDGSGAALTDARDVLLLGGRVARVAAAGSLDTLGVHVIEASGQYVMPGMIDLHAHIWDDRFPLLSLHNGVTTVRDIASQRIKTPDSRNLIEAGARPGPRIVYGGAVFHSGFGYTTITDQMVTDSAEIRRGVAILAGMGAQFLKERRFDTWSGAVYLVREAHRHGIRVSGHCEHILPVAAEGVDGREHASGCFRDWGIVRGDFTALTRAAGQWLTPTAAIRYTPPLVARDSSLLSAPDVAPFLAPQYRQFYPADSAARAGAVTQMASVARLWRSVRSYHDDGVRIVAGTDNVFPLGMHHELDALVQSGLTPMQAIVAATGDAARALGSPEVGIVEPGRWADLLILNANPLDDIVNTRNIRAVIQGGRVVDREAVRALAATAR